MWKLVCFVGHSFKRDLLIVKLLNVTLLIGFRTFIFGLGMLNVFVPLEQKYRKISDKKLSREFESLSKLDTLSICAQVIINLEIL